MTRICSRAAFALAALWPLVGTVPATAQTDAIPQNPQIDVVYGQAASPEFQAIRERLSKRQVLEQLAQFLSPLRLPRKLTVQIDQCGPAGRNYVAGGPVTVCYEYIDRVRRLAPEKPPQGYPPRDVMMVGAFVQAILHEVSLAVFDIYQVPVWGREKDAADKLAAFIMMQFGKDVARTTLLGTAWFFEASDRRWTGSDFSDVRSPEAQRYYNYLCIALGGDPGSFQYLVHNKMLPPRRAARCGREYQQVQEAFVKTVMPHVDQELLKKVRGMAIIKAGDVR
jgi:hypothetical protein